MKTDPEKTETPNMAIYDSASGEGTKVELVEAFEFFPAEEYHQRYLEKRGLAACHVRRS